MSATASVLTIGNELVSGDVANTTASWLARRLAPLGVEVRLTAALPDEIDVVADFDPVMPTFAGQVSEEDIQALVAFIREGAVP